MTIQIRPIRTGEEYRTVEQLQREVWGMHDVEVVDHCLLLTAHKNGGLVLGAFDPEAPGGERMIGFVFGLVGLKPDGRPKHCSHMAGVLAAYQGQDVGYRLKLAQRDYVLAQGLDLITWTYDPLESRNAHFNFRKLGVTCRTYLRNLYGDMRDSLNAGLPTDRCQVDWHITGDHVAARLAGAGLPPTLMALQAAGVPLVNSFPAGPLPHPAETILPFVGEMLLVQIPLNFQSIKAGDLPLAQAWREHTRLILETAFNQGYTAIDFLVENGQGYYLLRFLLKQTSYSLRG